MCVEVVRENPMEVDYEIRTDFRYVVCRPQALLVEGFAYGAKFYENLPRKEDRQAIASWFLFGRQCDTWCLTL